MEEEETQTGMAFLELVNERLDHIKKFNSSSHFKDVRYHAMRWRKEWDGCSCQNIDADMIESYLFNRSDVSNLVANKELQYLRALFNYGKEKKIIADNPTDGLPFFPVKKSKRYIPTKEDVSKVISVADPDTQDYLGTILLTAGRVNEINSLTWDDVNFEKRVVTLWTRKRKYGNLEPRDIPMIDKLHEILKARYETRDLTKPWVFWHSYWSRTEKRHVSGPYGDRKKIMKSLCSKAGVRYFRFHPLRHLTASILDDLGVPIGVIQRILGHQNRKTTEIYLQSVEDAERVAMNKLAGVDLFSADTIENQNQPKNVHKEYWHRKVERPPYRILKEEIDSLGYVGTGKRYGVSDNAIRKWVKFYERRLEKVA